VTESGNNKPGPEDTEGVPPAIESPAAGAPVQPEQSGQTEPAEPAAAEAAGFDPVALEDTVESQLDSIRAQADEYLEGWQRARADFANYKKRIEREQAEARDRIAGDTLMRLLGVMDDLERALKDRPTDGEAASWADGIELIYRKLGALFIAEGVEEIQAEGTPFDPVLHEALSHEESDGHAEGHVIEVVRRGYRMGDRVLRPALVRVSK
jgi:molecular chaperone GrpE